MADIIIDIASEFTGTKAFQKAENSTEKLTKSVKSLAKTFGIVFGTAQVVAFGKASVKAAAEDQKAQKQLALSLKNVGLGRDAASTESYIQGLQSEFGIVDDKLRPAYQTLAIATRDTAESQKLLNLSLDISAATGKDLSTVSAALSKAYLGNNTALSKLGVGISKADLKAGNFNDIVEQLSVTFAGSATQAANTFQGSIDKLAVASQNVKEIIGTGLIDAFKTLGQDHTVDDVASSMEDVALYIGDAIRGVGILVSEIKKIPGAGIFGQAFAFSQKTSLLGFLADLGKKQRQTAEAQGTSAQALAHLAELQSNYAIKTLNTTKKLTTEQLKQLKAKQLQQAIDKANLALGKGEDIFNMDKIQIAAALANQAEQLGKATTGSQLLQIANDTARLNVKRDILNLEDAIASKDQAAIEAATKKLNEDMKILGALTGQKVTLTTIESILAGLKPKDLVNQSNLDEALRKIKEMLSLLAQVKTPSVGGGSGSGGFNGGGGGGGGATVIPPDTYAGFKIKEAADAVTYFGQSVTDAFQTIEDSGAFNALVKAYAGGAINPFNAGSFRMAEGGSVFNSGAVGARDINITIQANTIANPDELTGLIQDTMIRLNKRGDFITTAGAL